MVRTSGYVNLIGATADDARDIMIEGESGILAVCPNGERPLYRPSSRSLVWPNGAKSLIFTADEPDRLRGKQHMKLWCDELASWRYPEAWDMAMLGLRLGDNPQACVTTTPRPIKVVRDLLKDEACVVTRGSTFDNRANLAPGFFRDIVRKYEGTRLGRQELNAEVLDDNPNALWRRSRIDELRVQAAPQLKRVVVAVDVAVTEGEEAADTGIIVAGLGDDSHCYVLADLSINADPNTWGKKVVEAYRTYQADRIVAEVNQGGDLIEMLLRTIDRSVSYKAVRASRGKMTRAEPVAALYEQGRVHHVGSLPKLEDECCEYDPVTAERSPDRMDALVWALTELMVEEPAEGTNLIKGWKKWAAPKDASGKEVPLECEQIFIAPALEVTDAGVWWCATCWGVFTPPNEKLASAMVLEEIRGSGTLPNFVDAVAALNKRHKAEYVVLSKAKDLDPVHRALRMAKLFARRVRYDPDTGPQTAGELVSAGRGWLPERTWARRLVTDVSRFPAVGTELAAHSVALALNWLRLFGQVIPQEDLPEKDDENKPKPKERAPIYG